MDILFQLSAICAFSYCLLFMLKAFGVDFSLFNPKPDYRLYLNGEEIVPNKNTKNIYIVHEHTITKTEVKEEAIHPKAKYLNKNDQKLSDILASKKKELPKFNTNIFD